MPHHRASRATPAFAPPTLVRASFAARPWPLGRSSLTAPPPLPRLPPLRRLQGVPRRARMSAAVPTPPPPPPPPHDGDDGDGVARPDASAERQADDVPAPAPSGVPPAEAQFSQEVLRRRMSDLDTQHASPAPGSLASDTLVDLTSYEASGALDLSDHSATHIDDLSDIDAEELTRLFDTISGVWVIVFTNAVNGEEGVYSLSIGDDNVVLAFQERDEATRYAVCLEAQQFPEPQICKMDATDLKTFCEESGFKLGFVPSGMVIMPPEESAVDDIDDWRGTPQVGSTGMSEEDIDALRKRFDTLFGQ